MKYRIEYTGKPCKVVNSSRELIQYLVNLKNETITDIRKLYKNGVSDSVMETYQRFIPN